MGYHGIVFFRQSFRPARLYQGSGAGYCKYFTHSTGHGVGVEIHEFPNLSPASDSILKNGNLVTVEPGIYIPGKFGVRIEDMALITENGCNNLTNAPKELLIL